MWHKTGLAQTAPGSVQVVLGKHGQLTSSRRPASMPGTRQGARHRAAPTQSLKHLFLHSHGCSADTPQLLEMDREGELGSKRGRKGSGKSKFSVG